MSGTRPTAPDAAARWDSSPTTVTRGVSPNVAQRRARALGVDDGAKSKPKRSSGGAPRRPQPGEKQESALSNLLGLLWIALGGIVIVLCLLFVGGSIVMFGVLREISDARNFDDAVQRTSAYEEFFKQIGAAGFQVDADHPNIKEGVTQYLWSVMPPNEGSRRVFSWEHDLQSNQMRPTSNAAAMLDIAKGYLTPEQAQAFAQVTVQTAAGQVTREVFQFDPNDETTKAIIDGNVAKFARTDGSGWGVGPQQPQLALTAPPLPPPLVDPKARSRRLPGVAAQPADDQEADAQDPTDGGDGDKAADASGDDQNKDKDGQGKEQPQPPVEVQPQPKPPADGDGGGSKPDPDKPDPNKPDPNKPGDGDGDGDATPVK